MSYTFSRRNFMKFTALTAAAVALSGSLTGCSNPNQPSAVYGTSADSELSFGGSNFPTITKTDSQVLKAGAEYKNGALTCDFEHTATTGGVFSCTKDRYQITIYYEDGSAKGYTDGSVCGEATVKFASEGGVAGMDANVPYKNKLTITGIDYTDATKVVISYFPRYVAVGSTNDSYSDVHANWDITSLFV